ncbi:hypothetical protein Mapa_006959 [Marchantia paleacea]|nr:hypothetical protein Mapa_006959 [Marchantia paleacea]
MTVNGTFRLRALGLLAFSPQAPRPHIIEGGGKLYYSLCVCTITHHSISPPPKRSLDPLIPLLSRRCIRNPSTLVLKLLTAENSGLALTSFRRQGFVCSASDGTRSLVRVKPLAERFVLRIL